MPEDDAPGEIMKADIQATLSGEIPVLFGVKIVVSKYLPYTDKHGDTVHFIFVPDMRCAMSEEYYHRPKTLEQQGLRGLLTPTP